MSNAVAESRGPRTLLLAVIPFVLLASVALAIYSNAWPNALVHDDKLFAGSQRYTDLSNIPRYFRESVWASAGEATVFYRPLLLASVTLDARLWGDWVAGYHLTNIFLHGLATLLVYAFLLQMLRLVHGQSAPVARYAMFAALLFAVHPVNTEVVNSIFNRSELLVAVGGLAGLLWFVKYMNLRPARAWAGLGLSYLVTLFCRETAVTLPGLAVVLVLILSPEHGTAKIRKCLAALWLALPLLLYLGLRSQALSPTESTAAVQAIDALDTQPAGATLTGFEIPDWRRLMEVAGFAFECLKVYLWPVPLKIAYGEIPNSSQIIGLIVHLLLLGTAVYSAMLKRPALLIGLVFFYLALLPASRIVGDPVLGPLFAERFLYFPSVGLMILVAFGLRSVGHRLGFPMAAAAIALALGLLAPITWARNAVWSSDVELFESEYRNGNRVSRAMIALTAAHLQRAHYPRVAEICDENTGLQSQSDSLSMHCAMAYGHLGRLEEAERAYLKATSSPSIRAVAHANLARFYLRQDRWMEAKLHFEQAAEAETMPANRAFRQGYMLVRLYPNDREKLLEARTLFEQALEWQPAFAPARHWLERLNRALGPAE